MGIFYRESECRSSEAEDSLRVFAVMHKIAIVTAATYFGDLSIGDLPARYGLGKGGVVGGLAAGGGG